ncbi:MAG TPA: hypothetical protein VLG50_07660 [Candidatus Saccharimonadales bacterium]|nr:hypothetical protein [Candidatus Saccharimonadales bacterium]
MIDDATDRIMDKLKYNTIKKPVLLNNNDIEPILSRRLNQYKESRTVLPYVEKMNHVTQNLDDMVPAPTSSRNALPYVEKMNHFTKKPILSQSFQNLDDMVPVSMPVPVSEYVPVPISVPVTAPSSKNLYTINFSIPGNRKVTHHFDPNTPFSDVVMQLQDDLNHYDGLIFILPPDKVITSDLSTPIYLCGMQDGSTIIVAIV